MNTRNLTLATLGVTGAAGLGAVAIPAAADAATATRYSGTNVQTQEGAVKVTITVTKKKITAISVVTTWESARSEQLQTEAVAVLRTEALKGQTYKVHAVSGATYTSAGFNSSLHSAMNHAKLF